VSEQIFDMGGPDGSGCAGDLEKRSACILEDAKLLYRTAQSGDKWCPRPVKSQKWPLNQSGVTM